MFYCFAGVQGRRFSETLRPYLQEGNYDITGECFRSGWVAFITYIVQLSKGLSCPNFGEIVLFYALMMGG